MSTISATTTPIPSVRLFVEQDVLRHRAAERHLQAVGPGGRGGAGERVETGGPVE